MDYCSKVCNIHAYKKIYVHNIFPYNWWANIGTQNVTSSIFTKYGMPVGAHVIK